MSFDRSLSLGWSFSGNFFERETGWREHCGYQSLEIHQTWCLKIEKRLGNNDLKEFSMLALAPVIGLFWTAKRSETSPSRICLHMNDTVPKRIKACFWCLPLDIVRMHSTP